MLFYVFVGVSAYRNAATLGRDIHVSLTNSGPAVRGANVTFTATIVSGYEGENFKFVLTDDAFPKHHVEVSIY